MSTTLLVAALLATPAATPTEVELRLLDAYLAEPQGISVRPDTSSGRPTYEEYRRNALDTSWRRGQAVLQGYFGAARIDDLSRRGGSGSDMDGSGESIARYPVIGGGAQWKLTGQRVDLGLEAMFNIAWRSGGTAFAFGGNGATVAVKVDMWMVDLYGGPFLSLPLGEHARAYAAAGPMMSFAEYRQDASDQLERQNGTGFGTGVYGRLGLEFEAWRGTYIGVGARYQDSTVDLGRELGDLGLAGWQYVVTITEGF